MQEESLETRVQDASPSSSLSLNPLVNSFKRAAAKKSKDDIDVAKDDS